MKEKSPNKEQHPKDRFSAAHQFLRAIIERFPKAPALTLAKKAYHQHPELWPSLETCRGMVRYILGTAGARSRKRAANKNLFRKPREAGAEWSAIIGAPAKQGRWDPLIIEGEQRALILSDIHFPFHDPEALRVALEYGESRNPTIILLNGDIADHYDISRWEKDPRLRMFSREVKIVRRFLKGLRERFPKARIIYKHGNHEERYERYMRVKASELLDIADFSWERVFRLKKYRVELVTSKRPIRLGQLNIIHGHEYVFNISSPVNPARGLYLRAKRHGLCGHFHQSSQHSEKDIEQKVVSTWSVGCLCDLHPEYRPLNQWCHGFAFVETTKTGAFMVNNLRIINGKAWS